MVSAKMVELLSPAGGMDCLTAAVKNGAHAVYLGLDTFSARQGAENFDRQRFLEAVALCAAANVKIYVTLNTLLTDRQLPLMESTIRFLAQAGADGVIVQDLATARLVRSIAPTLPLHASTQMCIYNLEGAQLLEQLGFTRVVLARELSAQEIAHITANTSLETEVFVHGALCMCYSGHCYFSSVIGRNSGNRGRCAQPCRLPYEGGYPLSLKDLSLLEHLQELTAAGVTSLKIEGRLKSPEYVGSVTAAFADALAGKAPERETIKHLEDLFSRDGFTDGYWTGKQQDMFGIKTPTAYGDYKAAVAALNRRKPAKRFTLEVSLRAALGAPCEWTFSDGKQRITLQSDAPAPAQNKPLNEEQLHRGLDKLQDTPYELRRVTLLTNDAVFLPVSLINDIRRQGIAALDALRVKTPHPTREVATTLTPTDRSGGMQVVYHRGEAFCPTVDHTRFDAVWLRPEDRELYHGENRGIHIDHFYPAHLLEQLLDELAADGIRRVLIGNLGHILPCRKRGFEIYGDYGLNITNSLSLNELHGLGLREACLSFELSLPQVRDLQITLPASLIVYGRLPLMYFKNCVIKNKGCIHHQGFGKLTDRMGHTFPLACRPHCGNILYNSLPLLLESAELQDLPNIGKRFDFTDETAAQAADILQNYASLHRADGNYTAGLYKRGVR